MHGLTHTDKYKYKLLFLRDSLSTSWSPLCMMTSADARVLVFGLRTGEGVPGGGLLSPSGKEQSLGRWSALPWVPGKGDLRTAAVMVGGGGVSILIP